MNPNDPAHRPPARPPRPAGPPPLPPATAGQQVGQAARLASGRRQPGAAAQGNESPRAAGHEAPVVDVRLLVLVAVGAAILGGVVVLFLGMRGSRQELAAAVRSSPSGRLDSKSAPSAVDEAKPKPDLTEPAKGPSPAELAEEANRRAEAAAREQAEQAKVARQQAFRQLRQALEKSGHRPLKADGNLENKDKLKIEICRLGAAEVEVSLPGVGVFPAPAGASEMLCTGPKGGPWSIAVKPQRDVNAKPTEIGQVAVEGEGEARTLTLTLLPMPTTRDPIWVSARQALTTVALVLRLPGEQPSADFETFVQLCTPKRLGPLMLEELLTDGKWLPKANGNPGEKAYANPLPDTPWPCRVELEGRGPEGITAKVTSASMEPKFIASQSGLEPLEVTAQWAWSGEAQEPFMETTLSLQNRASGPEAGLGTGSSFDVNGPAFDVLVVSQKVLPPWDGWRRLRDIDDMNKENPKPLAFLPPNMRKDFEQLPAAGTMTLGQLHKFRMIAVEHMGRLDPVSAKDLGTGEFPVSTPKPLPELKKGLRAVLKEQSTYLSWVNQEAPEPQGGEPDKKKDPGGHKNFHEAKAKRNKYLEANESEVREFWTDLREALKKDAEKKPQERDKVLETVDLPVIICSLLFDLEPVLAEKQKTKGLVEAVGDGTVEFTGKVWAEAERRGDNTAKYKVLLAEFAPNVSAGALP